MPHMIFTSTGNVYRRNPASATISPVSLPSGASVVSPAIRPSMVRYRGKVYIAGLYTKVLTWDPASPALYVTGVTQTPSVAPVLAVGATAEIEGIVIGYYTFKIKVGSEVLFESALSPASSPLELDGRGAAWSGLPATSTDTRVTHLGLYRSVDGEIPAHVADIAIGTTTYSDVIETDDLGETVPVRTGIDGAQEIDTDANGAPPDGARYAIEYHDAVWYAGDPDHPDRIWPSELFRPWAVNTSESNGKWLRTRDGEPVRGLAKHGDELIVLCRNAIYAIQGYSAGDYSMRKISSSIGGISHHSAVNVGPYGDLWFASQDGVCIYNGGVPRLAMEDIRDYWRDAYRADVDHYEDCFAAVSEIDRCYLLWIPTGDSTTTFRYVGHYEPVQEGSQPFWTFDTLAGREETCAGQVADEGIFKEVYVGASDLYLRKIDDYTNDDDDGDAGAKTFDVTLRHFWVGGEQSGDSAHGGAAVDLDLFMKHENEAVEVSVYGGDDTARSADPQFQRTLAATALSGYPAKTSSRMTLTKTGGKGFSVRLRATRPLGLQVRGIALTAMVGHQARNTT